MVVCKQKLQSQRRKLPAELGGFTGTLEGALVVWLGDEPFLEGVLVLAEWVEFGRSLERDGLGCSPRRALSFLTLLPVSKAERTETA